MKNVNIFANGKQIAVIQAKTCKEALSSFIPTLFLNRKFAPIVDNHMATIGGIKYQAKFAGK